MSPQTAEKIQQIPLQLARIDLDIVAEIYPPPDDDLFLRFRCLRCGETWTDGYDHRGGLFWWNPRSQDIAVFHRQNCPARLRVGEDRP